MVHYSDDAWTNALFMQPECTGELCGIPELDFDLDPLLGKERDEREKEQDD